MRGMSMSMSMSMSVSEFGKGIALPSPILGPELGLGPQQVL